MSKVLIIEDEKALSDAFKMILEKNGYEVAVAYNGEEGLDVAESFEPDLILLDLLMPIKSGLEFLQDYDHDQKHPNVKIIIFSNLDMQKEAESAFAMGATKYILKSWATPKTLVKIVAEEINSVKK